VQQNHNLNLFFKFSLLCHIYSVCFCHSGSNFPFDSDMTPFKIFLDVRYKKLVFQKNLKSGLYFILISGFRHDVDVICGLLGNYTASLVNNYHATPCNYPKDHRLYFVYLFYAHCVQFHCSHHC
jgi:hypothetical protein